MIRDRWLRTSNDCRLSPVRDDPPQPTRGTRMRVVLNRVMLHVQDVDRLANFYQQVFGLPVVEKIKGDWSVLDAGPCQLALHRVGTAYRVADPASWKAESNAKLVMT